MKQKGLLFVKEVNIILPVVNLISKQVITNFALYVK